MGFTFLHTADWQLGRPFARFGGELSVRLQDARLEVITTIADTARRRGLRHVLVAGDVWDQSAPSPAQLRRPIGRMADASDLVWWLLPGNHDPAGPESLWERLVELGVPGNVRLVTTPEPREMETGVFLLPAPWTTKRPARDLTEALGAMPTPAGAVRIGLAHGAIAEIGESHAVIAADRADRAGLHYLALGDWHGTKKAAPRSWYAGTPEPDRFRNNDQGNVLIVDTDAPDAPEAVRTRAFVWIMRDAVLYPGEDPAEALGLAALSEGPRDRVLLRLELSGEISLADRRRLDSRLDALGEELAALRIRDDGLRLVTDAADAEAAWGEGALRAVAERLLQRREAGEAADAEAALRLLDGFARG